MGSVDLRDRPLRVSTIAPGEVDGRVRHIDQLPPGDLERFLSLVGGHHESPGETLSVGEVIVYDEYYRLEPA